MSALPNPSGLKYFDNSNNTPAPQGVQVAFNQESQDVWIGYDTATLQVCITNYNRTVTLVCFAGSEAAGCQLYYKTAGGFVNPGAQIPLSTGEVLKNMTRGLAPNESKRAKVVIAGYYSIDFGVYADPNFNPGPSVAIAKNGVVVPDMNFALTPGTEHTIYGQAVLALAAGDEISLINSALGQMAMPLSASALAASLKMVRFAGL
jgi:hypothetical protein